MRHEMLVGEGSPLVDAEVECDRALAALHQPNGPAGAAVDALVRVLLDLQMALSQRDDGRVARNRERLVAARAAVAEFWPEPARRRERAARRRLFAATDRALLVL